MKVIIFNGTDDARHECLNVESIEIKRDGSIKMMHTGGKVPRLFTHVTRVYLCEVEEPSPCQRKHDRYQMEAERVSALHFVFSRAGIHLLAPSSNDEVMLSEALSVVRERELYSRVTDDGDIIRPLRRTLARLRSTAEKSRSGG